MFFEYNTHHHPLYNLTVDIVGSTLLYQVYIFRLWYSIISTPRLLLQNAFSLRAKWQNVALYYTHEEKG